MKVNTNRVELMISAVQKKQYPNTSMPEIALAGRSNVGKSSLINKVLNRKSLARVSGTPGKTVTINFYNVDNQLMLVDLPVPLSPYSSTLLAGLPSTKALVFSRSFCF